VNEGKLDYAGFWLYPPGVKAAEPVLKPLAPVLGYAYMFGTKALASTLGLDHYWAIGN